MKSIRWATSAAFLAATVTLAIQLRESRAENAGLHSDLSMVMGASVTPDPCLANLAKVTASPTFVSCKAGQFVVLRRQ
ncbi:exported hypothetical protein [Paraburkholderia ribeironis]|uniref:Uncharacterized protein n=1 Tax=Paraburkholderia ribeironis TaxID=1247936 RepID=A0A1N7SQN1_9BURK|nr:exported hypothetical protein [Paraburkholderia ribeironis]